MTVRDDLAINRQIRRIMVKHWIDLGRLSVRSHDGSVLVRGHLQRVEGVGTELTNQIVESIFHETKRVPGAIRVKVYLENWANDSGGWRPVERGEQRRMVTFKRKAAAAGAASGRGGSVGLDKPEAPPPPEPTMEPPTP